MCNLRHKANVSFIVYCQAKQWPPIRTNLSSVLPVCDWLAVAHPRELDTDRVLDWTVKCYWMGYDHLEI